MSGVQEGKGFPLNQLITLSLNFSSSHSLTLSAVWLRGAVLLQPETLSGEYCPHF